MSTNKESVGVIRCGLGQSAYCFEMSMVSGVRQSKTMEPNLDHTPGDPVGWVSGAHEPVAVHSLNERFGGNEPELNQRGQVVVVNSSHGPVGWLTQTVSRVMQVPTSRLMRVPALLNDPATRFFKAVVELKDDEHAPQSQNLTSIDARLAARQTGSRTHTNGDAPAPTALNHLQFSAQTSSHAGELVLLVSPERIHPLARRIGVSKTAAPQPEPEVATPTGTKSNGQLLLVPVTEERIGVLPFTCGLSVTQILEVLEPLPITPVPTTLAPVKGFVSWRGQPVPFVSLAECLGLREKGQPARLIIASTGDDSSPVAFHVAAGIRARRLPLEHCPLPTPGRLNAELVLGTYEVETELLVIPDLHRLAARQWTQCS